MLDWSLNRALRRALRRPRARLSVSLAVRRRRPHRARRSFEDSPGLCSKRPRESVRVPLLARAHTHTHTRPAQAAALRPYMSRVLDGVITRESAAELDAAPGTLLGGASSAPPRQASLLSGSLNLLNTIVGGGILALPFAFRSSGLVAGVLSQLVFGGMSWHGCVLLLRAARRAEPAKATYEDLARVALGRPGWLAYHGCAFVNCFGSCVSYVIVAGDPPPLCLVKSGCSYSCEVTIGWRCPPPSRRQRRPVDRPPAAAAPRRRACHLPTRLTARHLFAALRLRRRHRHLFFLCPRPPLLVGGRPSAAAAALRLPEQRRRVRARRPDLRVRLHVPDESLPDLRRDRPANPVPHAPPHRRSPLAAALSLSLCATALHSGSRRD